MERDAEGLEDEAVLMSVQRVLTCGIMQDYRPITHAGEKATGDIRRAGL